MESMTFNELTGKGFSWIEALRMQVNVIYPI